MYNRLFRRKRPRSQDMSELRCVVMSELGHILV